jgi:hypothetical protein
MSNFQIKHRWTDVVLFEGNFDTMRLCVEAAVKSRANLAGANLAGAYLGGAYLAGAYLAGAYLGGAYLAGAYLGGANLARANLARAYLAGAYLGGANLAGAKWREGVTLNRAPVKECTRTDGYRFLLLDTDAGWRVQAGCRFFSMDEAWRHWEATRAGTDLGDETFDILVMFEHQIERDARK